MIIENPQSDYDALDIEEGCERGVFGFVGADIMGRGGHLTGARRVGCRPLADIHVRMRRL